MTLGQIPFTTSEKNERNYYQFMSVIKLQGIIAE